MAKSVKEMRIDGVCGKCEKDGLGGVVGAEKSSRIYELLLDAKGRAEREANEACFEGEGWEDAREHAEDGGGVKVDGKTCGDCGGEKKESVEEPICWK
jgi:hypothetical protein